ncbi:MAG TPA: hypothetical protein PKA37_09670, partial [Planctomycetota bacterium]|nr:hypothetical protein [Planctomycetota bacterium]
MRLRTLQFAVLCCLLPLTAPAVVGQTEPSDFERASKAASQWNGAYRMRRPTTGFSEDGRWFYSSAPEPLAVPFLYDLKAEAEAKILGKEAFERALREHPEHSKALSQ